MVQLAIWSNLSTARFVEALAALVLINQSALEFLSYQEHITDQDFLSVGNHRRHHLEFGASCNHRQRKKCGIKVCIYFLQGHGRKPHQKIRNYYSDNHNEDLRPFAK